jgi:uncharacterized repeat protein (TIGR03803 family)
MSILGGPGRASMPVFRWLAAVVLGAGLAAAADGQAYSILYAFSAPPSTPAAKLIRASDGSFYGTTQSGGGAGSGTVFRMDSSGNITLLHDFTGADGAAPLGPLLEFGGFFYGTTSLAGPDDAGTVFKVDASGNFTTLHAFAGGSDGAHPQGGLVRASDGNFYGTTAYGGGIDNLGTVFKMDPSGTVTILRSFSGSDGTLPYGGLVLATDGKFYGTTSGGGNPGGGTIFRIDSAGGSFLTLHNFVPGTDGGDLRAPLIQASDQRLYGTAYGGGANGNGTIYGIDLAGTNFMNLHDFTAAEGGAVWAPVVQGTDGKLYGTTEIGGTSTACNGFNCGTTYRIDAGGTNFATLHSFNATDGSLPYAGLVQGTDGNFYGVTTAGGTIGGGTAFQMTSAGAVTTLHSFGGPGSGHEPEAPVMQATDGNFYGTTRLGGTAGHGTVFKLDPAGNYTLLHSFIDTDGSYPEAGLVQASDGDLYGTTSSGGTPGLGTVFRLDTAGGNFETLHNFAITDGDTPRGRLLLANDGKMYGTTSDGGTPAGSTGTLFRVDIAGGFATLHNFTSTEAAIIFAPLVQGTDGNLYGTSSAGGSMAGGTVFRATLAGAVTPLHEFVDAEGTGPQGGLIQAPDGNFYGTTRTGGAHGFGTVFRVTTAGAVTDLHDFVAGDGWGSIAGLLRSSDGRLYGTAYNGGPGGNGTLFRIDTTGANFAVVHGFSGSDGGGPAAPVIQGTDGALYGTANHAGFGAGGVVFRETLCSPPVVTASSNSPVCAGQTLSLSATTIPGATYAWTGPNGFASTLQNPSIASVTFAAAGTYSVIATVAGCASAPSTTNVVIRGPSATITAPASACASSTGNGASVPSAGAGATYAWGITNGTITSGAGTRQITFSAGTSGSVQLSVTVTDSNGCAAMNSVAVPITVCVAMQFHTLTPCRIADTRNPAGPLGGPALAANASRTFNVTGACGVPTTARVVSINVTITQPTAAGDLRLYPAGTVLPLVSTINYRTGQTRANNAVASLGTGGGVSVRCDQASGTVQFILDVNGWFE